MSDLHDNLAEYKQALEEEFEKLSRLDDPIAIAEGWRKYLIPHQAKFAQQLKLLALGAESEGVQLSALKYIHAILTQSNEEANPDVLKELLLDIRKED